MRRTGSRRRPSATPRRPATSTGWHGWSSVALSPPTRAVASRPRSAGSIGWKHHGAFERNALVAVIGAVIATAQGRPEQAERFADAAEHAYDRTLPDGSPTILAWLCILRAQRCHRGVARMRADAELALRTPARGSRFRSHAMVLLAVSQWLAGEVDQADDLFADAVEEGLELGAHEVAAVALGERAAVAIGRGAMGRGGGVRRASASGRPPCAAGRVPHQRVRLCAGGPRRAPPRRSPARPRAPRTGATPAAAAHLRDAAPGRPDAAWSLPAPT